VARALVLKLGDEESRFGITKLDRDKLYGKKERVIVDEENRPCQPAWLTADGSALVPLGGTAHVWIDEGWGSAEQSERKAVDQEGNALVEHPSTLDVPQLATAVPPERVLDHVTSTIYELTPDSLGDAMRAALEGGAIFEVPFAYRGGHEQDRAFVLGNAEGIFALVGRPTGFSMLSHQVQPALEGPEDDELEGDLDFSMM
jgi:hypothetical protein